MSEQSDLELVANTEGADLDDAGDEDPRRQCRGTFEFQGLIVYAAPRILTGTPDRPEWKKMKLLVVTAKPAFQIAPDRRTLADEEGHRFDGRSEFLLLSAGERRLRIPWRILESDDRSRPPLSADETYTFEIDDDEPPRMLRVLRGKTLLFAAEPSG